MRKGFSFLEVVIALGILAMLTAAILPSLTSFNSSINSTITNVNSILHKYSYNSTTASVIFNTASITIYENFTYQTPFLDFQVK